MESVDPPSRALSKALGVTAAHVPVNAKTNMSSLRPSLVLDRPAIFARENAMDGPPLRLQDQSKILEGLDKLYNATKHPLLDTKHMFGRGHALAPNTENYEPTAHEPRQLLARHVDHRQPYVKLASKRLQTVMGTTSQRVFDLPFHIFPRPALAPNSISTVSNNLKRKNSAVVLAGSKFSSDRGIQVDPATGRGMREWLLAMGRANGSQRKQSCNSISFHDLRPDEQGGFSNVLIGHFAAGDMGRRVDAYEVLLPVMILDPNTGVEKEVFEQWLWFMISRPLISLSSKHMLKASISAKRKASFQKFMPQPAPSFPHPVPISWVVFACPGTSITAYPSFIETYSAPPPMKSKYPFLNGHDESQNAMTFHRRKNYDFCHDGIPVFEFSEGKNIFFPPMANVPRFLSVDGIDGFNPAGDHDFSRTPPYYQLAAVLAQDRFKKMNPEELKKERANGRERENESVGQFHGDWWDSFVDRAYDDAGRWKRIAKSMVGGKCRVVVRWSELDEDAMLIDPELLLETGEAKNDDREVDLGLLVGEDEGVIAKKKQKVSISGKAVLAGEKGMRSQPKSRSVLSDQVMGGEMSMTDEKGVPVKRASKSTQGKKRGSKKG